MASPLTIWIGESTPLPTICIDIISLTGYPSDLAKFIANDRISCTIDRVNGIIETNRPDNKNKQYADVVKHGDALITKLQKYGQTVRLRGSERS